VCWNSLYCRLLGFDSFKSLILFIATTGRLDLKHLILWRNLVFLEGVLQAGSSLLLDGLDTISGRSLSRVILGGLKVDLTEPHSVLYDY
jgi:hypothetical protein